MIDVVVDRRCPHCATDAKVIERWMKEFFPYGVGVDARTELPVTQPVLTCLSCEESWTDWRGEAIRDNAVACYLKGRQQCPPK